MDSKIRPTAEKYNANSSRLIIYKRNRNIPINSKGIWIPASLMFISVTFHLSFFTSGLLSYPVWTSLLCTAQSHGWNASSSACFTLNNCGWTWGIQWGASKTDRVNERQENKSFLLRTIHWMVPKGTKNCSFVRHRCQNLLLESLFFLECQIGIKCILIVIHIHFFSKSPRIGHKGSTHRVKLDVDAFFSFYSGCHWADALLSFNTRAS